MQEYEAVLLGIAAWVYSRLLLKEGMILGWLGKLIGRLPEWLSEPLGGCEYCVAGQFALWYYLYKHLVDYNIVNHIIFITLAIFTVELINRYGSKKD